MNMRARLGWEVGSETMTVPSRTSWGGAKFHSTYIKIQHNMLMSRSESLIKVRGMSSDASIGRDLRFSIHGLGRVLLIQVSRAPFFDVVIVTDALTWILLSRFIRFGHILPSNFFMVGSSRLTHIGPICLVASLSLFFLLTYTPWAHSTSWPRSDHPSFLDHHTLGSFCFMALP